MKAGARLAKWFILLSLSLSVAWSTSLEEALATEILEFKKHFREQCRLQVCAAAKERGSLDAKAFEKARSEVELGILFSGIVLAAKKKDTEQQEKVEALSQYIAALKTDPDLEADALAKEFFQQNLNNFFQNAADEYLSHYLKLKNQQDWDELQEALPGQYLFYCHLLRQKPEIVQVTDEIDLEGQIEQHVRSLIMKMEPVLTAEPSEMAQDPSKMQTLLKQILNNMVLSFDSAYAGGMRGMSISKKEQAMWASEMRDSQNLDTHIDSAFERLHVARRYYIQKIISRMHAKPDAASITEIFRVWEKNFQLYANYTELLSHVYNHRPDLKGKHAFCTEEN